MDGRVAADGSVGGSVSGGTTGGGDGGSERSEPSLGRASFKARTRSDSAATPRAPRNPHPLFPVPGSWAATLYPNAGEATVFYRRERAALPLMPRGPESLPGVQVDRDLIAEHVAALEGAGTRLADRNRDRVRVRREWEARYRRTKAVRVAQDRARNASRATKQVRIYCKEHKIGYMWTLTCTPKQRTRQITKANKMAVNFIDRLRDAQNVGQLPRFPFVLVLERHKSGYFHFHMGVPRFVKYQSMNPVWGHGLTLSPRLVTRGGGRPSISDLARYLAKYVSKTFSPEQGQTPKGMHRYHCARGFRAGARGPFVVSYSPEKWRCDFSNKATALEAVLSEGLEAGWEPPNVWYSDDAEDWRGPPCVVLNFTPGRVVFNQDRQPMIRLPQQEKSVSYA